MAGLRCAARKNGISTGIALKTLLQLLAATNQRVRLLEIAVAFHGIVNTNEPIQTDVMRQSTAGTMSALTPVTLDDDLAETVQTTAQHTATAEPTAGNILATWAIHPQTGLVYQVPKADEIMIKGAGRLGLCTTAPNSVNADAYLKFEE
jgi:hypothetical protein